MASIDQPRPRRWMGRSGFVKRPSEVLTGASQRSRVLHAVSHNNYASSLLENGTSGKPGGSLRPRGRGQFGDLGHDAGAGGEWGGQEKEGELETATNGGSPTVPSHVAIHPHHPTYPLRYGHESGQDSPSQQRVCPTLPPQSPMGPVPYTGTNAKAMNVVHNEER